MENELVKKTINWYKIASNSIHDAGGVPDFVIEKFPSDLLEILVKNDLHLVYIDKSQQ